MWSRIFSTLIAGTLVFFTVAGVSAVNIVSSKPAKLEVTDRPLDLSIGGEGYFAVKLPASAGGGVGYTRVGKLFTNARGELTVGVGDGLPFATPVMLPTQTTDINISSHGMVSVFIGKEIDRSEVGQLKLTYFARPKALRQSTIPGVYLASPLAGKMVETTPGANGAGELLEGCLDQSERL